MTWRAIAIAAALLAAEAVNAQTIVTRSGEHDGFARLVMRLPAGVDWSLTQSGKTATINIDSPDAVFDTSRVFNLIPRTRLQSLGQSGPGQPLRMQLGCDCTVTSYLQANDYLVVDIRDGGLPEPDVQYSTPGSILPLTSPAARNGYRFSFSQAAASDARIALELAAAAQNPTAQIIKPQETADDSAATEMATDLPPIPEGDISLPLSLADNAGASSRNEAEAVSELPATGMLLNLEETERAAAVKESERRLLQQIGRAANQGLLSVTADGFPGSDLAEGLDPLGRSDRPLNPLDHISVTSAIDRETGLMAALTEDTGAAEHCLANRVLAIDNWGDEEPFADQIGALRSALVQEFDTVHSASVYALARSYLYFGFGAEARSILTMLPQEEQAKTDATLLQSMADIMDGRALPVNHAFAGQQGCEGYSAFWGALADGTVKKSADTDAIQLTFSKLPKHLRIHFGPKLSKMFAEVGDHHVAEAILRAVDRTGIEEVPEINLAEAAIAELEGDAEKVAEELTDEVAERTGNAPAALIELVALSFKERKALSPDVPDLIASYELENRDTDLGAQLRHAQVASLALMGEFHEAFKELKSLEEHDGPHMRATAIEPLMHLLAERSDDVTFLQYGLAFARQATASEAAPVAIPVARRLLNLGFAEHAEALLHKLTNETDKETRQLMLAEAALVLNKPHQALMELMGLEGTEANRLRAKALWSNGEFGEAGQYLLAENETNAAARGFWHSENLGAIEAMENSETAQFSEVASVTSQIGETAEDPVGLTPLAHARALVQSSVGTRGSIATLLGQLGTGATEAQ